MHLAGFLAFAASLLPQAQEEFKLGPKVVQMRNCSYYASPPPPRNPLENPRPQYGDKVTAVGLEGNYAKVSLPNGQTAYVFRNALIDEGSFEPHPENDEEKMRLKAQNYKSGRFDSTTEKEYIRQKGGDMEKAYRAVDDLMARPSSKADRAKLERDLTVFRRQGKLGEFSSVK